MDRKPFFAFDFYRSFLMNRKTTVNHTFGFIFSFTFSFTDYDSKVNLLC
jgi:hypothetical protein